MLNLNKSIVCVATGLVWLLVGCNGPQNYTLNVSRTITINPNGNSSSGSKVPAGSYAMTVDGGGLFASPSVTLKGSNGTYAFDAGGLGSIADNIENEGNQQVDLSSSQLNQPFNLQLVSRQTLLNSGSTTTHSESCVAGQHSEQKYVCHNSGSSCDQYQEVCKQKPGTNGDTKSDFKCTQVCTHSSSQQNCGYETQTVTDYGSRNVSGRTNTYRTTTRLSVIQNGQTSAAIAPLVKDTSSFEETGSGVCN